MKRKTKPVDIRRRVQSFDDLVEYWAAYAGWDVPAGWQELPLYTMLGVMLAEIERLRGEARA